MKISDLSRESGTSIPTIKLYIRKGMLPPGNLTSPNQAVYDGGHLERLDLIGRLKEYAGLSIDTIANVLGAAGAKGTRYEAMGAGIDASGKDLVFAENNVQDASPGYVALRTLIKNKDWPLSEDDASLIEAARALDQALEGWPFDFPEDRLEQYADIASQLADIEITDDWREGLNQDGILKFALLGTFLFEPFILALRRMAHRVRILETLSDG